MDNINSTLCFQCFVVKNDVIYFMSYVGNALFAIEDNDVVFIGSVPNETTDYVEQLYGAMFLYDDEIILIPKVAKEIAIYKINENRFYKISIDSASANYSSKFISVYRNQQFLYLFPTRYPGIVKLNLIDKEYEIINSWLDTFGNYVVEERDVIFGHGYVQREDAIYIPSCRANVVVEMNILNDDIVFHNVGKRASCICDDGSNIWIMPRTMGGTIVNWNLASKKMVEIEVCLDNCQFSSFTAAFYFQGYVYAFPEVGTGILRINIITNTVEQIKIFAQDSYSYLFCSVHKISDGQLLCSTFGGEMFIFDLSEEKVVMRRKLKIPSVCANYYRRMYNEKRLEECAKRLSKRIIQGQVIENLESDLETYIQFIRKI